jgi:hypothetical protein
VGALGGLLSSGLLARLGPAAETAGALLSGRHGPVGVDVQGEALRHALEQSLLPVFAVLLALSLANFAMAGFFPDRADDHAPGGLGA